MGTPFVLLSNGHGHFRFSANPWRIPAQLISRCPRCRYKLSASEVVLLISFYFSWPEAFKCLLRLIAIYYKLE
jgi:hypothetical protein